MTSFELDPRTGNNHFMDQATTNLVAEVGARIYDSLRSELEPRHHGKYIVIDVDSGEYEIDAEHLAASDRAHAKHPGGRFYVARIGIPFRIRQVPGTVGARR